MSPQFSLAKFLCKLIELRGKILHNIHAYQKLVFNLCCTKYSCMYQPISHPEEQIKYICTALRYTIEVYASFVC